MSDIIKLNGDLLTRKQVIDVAIHFKKIALDTSKLDQSLHYIQKKVEQKKIIYGVTTGFGSNTDRMIDHKDIIDLQVNLLRSHATGIGKSFSTDIVRAIMLIRLNTLLKGYSGVQKSTVDQIAFCINNQIHPIIPEKGSVGASGDLCPLSHMALPLIGEGEIEYRGKRYTTEEFSKTKEAEKIGFKAIELRYKEGLALNNGTSVMAAIGTIALYRAERILTICTLSSSLIFESLGARSDAFSFEEFHRLRNHKGQIEVAKRLKQILKDSKLINISQSQIIYHVLENNLVIGKIKEILQEINHNQDNDQQEQIPNEIIQGLYALGKKEVADILQFGRLKWKPQDSYSIRCIPQVIGASKTAIDHVVAIVDAELNAAVDNPLIFARQDRVISGGNFHGQPLALVMDYLKLALSEIGNIVERQINKMLDSNTNDVLPRFLALGNGLQSGLMITQYAAAALVSENKVLVHPASADSIPTSQNIEDHVSMGTISARQALEIAENVEDILSIAIMTGFYAINLRLRQFEKVGMPSKAKKVLSPIVYKFYKLVEKSNLSFQESDFVEKDRFLSPELKNIKSNFEIFYQQFKNLYQ